MKKNKIIKIGIIVGLMIIFSGLTSISIEQNDKLENNLENYSTNNNFSPTITPVVEVTKKIKDGTEWVDVRNADIGSILQFNIKIKYNVDCGNRLTDIIVIDELPPCLDYYGDCTITHGDNIFYGESDINLKRITWKLTKDYGIILWDQIQNPGYPPEIVTIDYNVIVVGTTSQTGEKNIVDVDALESCCSVNRKGSDEATVIVEPDEPGIDIIKKVKDGSSWVDSTSVYVGDDVEFKLTVTNTGNLDLTNVHIIDELPSFLTYNYDATDSPTVELDHRIEWNLGTLSIGASEDIFFSAHADSVGDADNTVEVSSDEGVGDADNAHITVREISECDFIFEKTVWNETSNQWEESIKAEVGDIIRFNITVTYFGDYVLYNINISDILPNGIIYADNADPVESDISGNTVYWNLTGIFLADGESYSIEFDAEVTSTGTKINIANIIANECAGEKCEDEDTAIVYVESMKLFEKKVWNASSSQWEDSITAEIGDIVRFNITITYYGDYVLYNINITDTLPCCLIYANNADPVESGISSNVIYWNLTGVVLTDGDSYSIEFDAEVVSDGININTANIRADECDGSIWELEDTAKVVVVGPKLFEKKVWNASSSQWEDSITAEVGSIVRFNLSLSYYGPNILYDIKIRDMLPLCLEYENNADPEQTGISGNEIYWFIPGSITTGDSIYIEFDARVIEIGECINIANMTAQECTDGKIEEDDTAIIIGVEETDPLEADAGGPYSGYIDETISFSGSATGGKTPYTYSWDFDDGTTSDLQNPTHEYDTIGTYTVILTVTDDNGNTDTDNAQVTISEESINTKPDKPDRPTGDTQGNYGEEYTYSTKSTDPEGDQLQYLWDWGDGTNSGWIGPYNSGQTVEISHTWDEEGDYEIKVRARDTSGLMSDWSDPLQISMPRIRIFNNIIQLILDIIIERFPILEQIINNIFIKI